jgi:hypothetical protein
MGKARVGLEVEAARMWARRTGWAVWRERTAASATVAPVRGERRSARNVVPCGVSDAAHGVASIPSGARHWFSSWGSDTWVSAISSTGIIAAALAPGKRGD